MTLELSNLSTRLLAVALLIYAAAQLVEHTRIGDLPPTTPASCHQLCADQGATVKRWEIFACECYPPT